MKIVSENKPADTTIPVSNMGDGEIAVITQWGRHDTYVGRGVQRFGKDLITLRRSYGDSWSGRFEGEHDPDYRVRLVGEGQPFKVDEKGMLTLVDVPTDVPMTIDARQLQDGQVAVVVSAIDYSSDVGKPVQRLGDDLVLLGEPREASWKGLFNPDDDDRGVFVRVLAPGATLEV